MNDFPPIADLLPHRPPMRLVRTVLSHSAAETCCEAQIEPDFARACGGAAPAPFALELIAQAAAVRHGLALRERNADPSERPARGLLLGSRRLQLHCRELPTAVALKVFVLGSAGAAVGLIRFDGRVEDASGRILAEGDATVLEVPGEIALA